MSVFLYLKKAFDTVDHDLSLAKLADYGIIGGSYQWFPSNLTRRGQHCQIGGQMASRKALNTEYHRDRALGHFYSSFMQMILRSAWLSLPQTCMQMIPVQHVRRKI